jgi:hypothetical protein
VKHKLTSVSTFFSLMVLFSNSGHGGILLRYDFSAAPGDQTSQAASFVDGNATASLLTRGPGLTASSGSGSMNARGFTTNSAIDLDDYYSFSISPLAGHLLNITNLGFAERRSGSGIRTFEIRSSLDSFGTANGGIMSVPDNTGSRDQLISLSNLQNLTGPVEFRIYAYQAESSAGTWRLKNHSSTGGLTVDGSFSSVPEPSSAAIIGGMALLLAAVRRRRGWIAAK